MPKQVLALSARDEPSAQQTAPATRHQQLSPYAAGKLAVQRSRQPAPAPTSTLQQTAVATATTARKARSASR